MTGWQELDSDVQFGWRQSILVTELLEGRAMGEVHR
jgi:hypothetical protein